MDSALNHLQRLIYHKTKPNQTKPEIFKSNPSKSVWRPNKRFELFKALKVKKSFSQADVSIYTG